MQQFRIKSNLIVIKSYLFNFIFEGAREGALKMLSGCIYFFNSYFFFFIIVPLFFFGTNKHLLIYYIFIYYFTNFALINSLYCIITLL